MASLVRSFDRLADVEVQLCMQFCPLPALLQLARCSRRLHSQADSPFAFKHAPPRVLICSPTNPPVGLESLLRHVPMTLKPSVVWTDLDRMVALLPARFHGLDVLNMRLSYDGCARFLSLPSVQSIVSLQMDRAPAGWFSSESVAAVARLPLLQSLSMRGDDATSEESLRMLTASPTLTSLSFNDSNFTPSGRLRSLAEAPSLKHLSVYRPFIYSTDWVASFGSPGLSRLQSLEFDWCIFSGPQNCRPIDPDHAEDVFTSLSSLTSLHLKMPFGIDRLLPSLVHARSLRSLRIEANCSVYDASAHRTLPSFEILLPLLISKSELRISIDLRDHTSSLRDDYVPKLSTAFAQVDAAVRSRVSVLYAKPLWQH